MNTAPIGVFDSGIGGLTVVREIRKILPHEDIVYLGDTARLPYGSKSVEAIIQFSIENTEFLLNRGAKFIVVACYSATSAALEILQSRFDVPILGVIEPGVKRALAVTRNNRVGVIGTTLTIWSGAYEKSFRAQRSDCEVLGRACPLFVPLVEEGWLEHPATQLIATEYLSALKTDGIDTLLLGCTHYPLLMNVIRRVMGDINYVDASRELGAELASRLQNGGLANTSGNGSTTIYVTDLSMNFKTIAERFLGGTVGNVARVAMAHQTVPGKESL